MRTNLHDQNSNSPATPEAFEVFVVVTAEISVVSNEVNAVTSGRTNWLLKSSVLKHGHVFLKRLAYQSEPLSLATRLKTRRFARGCFTAVQHDGRLWRKLLEAHAKPTGRGLHRCGC